MLKGGIVGGFQDAGVRAFPVIAGVEPADTVFGPDPVNLLKCLTQRRAAAQELFQPGDTVPHRVSKGNEGSGSGFQGPDVKTLAIAGLDSVPFRGEEKNRGILRSCQQIAVGTQPTGKVLLGHFLTVHNRLLWIRQIILPDYITERYRNKRKRR